MNKFYENSRLQDRFVLLLLKGRETKNLNARPSNVLIPEENPSALADELGLPLWFLQLEERIYACMSSDMAATWSKQFAHAVCSGSFVNFSDIWQKFVVCYLGGFYGAVNAVVPEQEAAIKAMIAAYENGCTRDEITAAWYPLALLRDAANGVVSSTGPEAHVFPSEDARYLASAVASAVGAAYDAGALAIEQAVVTLSSTNFTAHVADAYAWTMCRRDVCKAGMPFAQVWDEKRRMVYDDMAQNLLRLLDGQDAT